MQFLTECSEGPVLYLCLPEEEGRFGKSGGSEGSGGVERDTFTLALSWSLAHSYHRITGKAIVHKILNTVGLI